MQTRREESVKTSLALNFAAGGGWVLVNAEPPDLATGLHEGQPLPRLRTSIPLLKSATHGLREALTMEIEMGPAQRVARTAPGKPNQNTFIKYFNRSCRTEVLNDWLCASPMFGVYLD